MSYVIYVATDGKIEGSYNHDIYICITNQVATDGKNKGSYNYGKDI